MASPPLFTLNCVAAVLHFVLFVACLGALPENFEAPLYDIATVHYKERSGLAELGVEQSGTLNFFACLMLFFLLTCAAHIFYAATSGTTYASFMRQAWNPVRWLEYSFTASLMMMVLAITAGVRSLSVLVLLAVATFCQMGCGFMIESAMRVHKPQEMTGRLAVLVPLLLGWVLWIATWSILLVAFEQNMEDADDLDAPKDVRSVRNWRPIAEATVYSEVVLFAAFGLVSMYDVATWFQGRRTEETFQNAELGYLVLSCVSKVLLGGLALGNTQGAEYYITNTRPTASALDIN